ncbi:tetratricopeptide repeat protein [Sphingomicrobium sp. XHP0239]|uniref:tetratricopeptide repeat protein n=1 Tax=Sphingomicrobium maritimum TaxID=3133972 RepID=UPI0031CCB65C
MAASIRYLLLATVALVVLGLLLMATRQPVVHQLSSLEANGYGARNFDAGLAERQIELERTVAHRERQDDSWLAREHEAMARFSHAKLDGSFSGMDRAYRQLTQAMALAPDMSGPQRSRAILALAMHRLDEAEIALDTIEARPVRLRATERAEVMAMRGDIAFYRGDYADAKTLYDSAIYLDPHPGQYVRLANWHQRMGDLDASLAAFDRAASVSDRVSPELASTLLLYAGGAHLKRGQWDEARDYFERADEAWPGYWLTEAHLAQLDAARGDLATAERRYRAILADHQEPSVMAAFATVLEAQGKRAEAERLTRRAETMFAEQAEAYPEAFADHVLDGAIGAGDMDAALAAARANHAARPYGDAKVGMGRALIAAGRPEDARKWLQQVHDSGWRSTEQYVAMADACEAMNDRDCVREARRRAEDFDRMAFADGGEFLAFGNH